MCLRLLLNQKSQITLLQSLSTIPKSDPSSDQHLTCVLAVVSIPRRQAFAHDTRRTCIVLFSSWCHSEVIATQSKYECTQRSGLWTTTLCPQRPVLCLPPQSQRSLSNLLFMCLQGGDGLPMFGVCYLVNQMLHTPPGLVKHKFRESGVSPSKHMVAAPRCYCLLSRYPFFELHFQVRSVLR